MAFQYNSNTVKALTYNGNDVKILKYNGNYAWAKPNTVSVTIDASSRFNSYYVTQDDSYEPTASLADLSLGNNTCYYGDTLRADISAADPTYEPWDIDSITKPGMTKAFSGAITISNPNNFTVTWYISDNPGVSPSIYLRTGTLSGGGSTTVTGFSTSTRFFYGRLTVTRSRAKTTHYCYAKIGSAESEKSSSSSVHKSVTTTIYGDTSVQFLSYDSTGPGDTELLQSSNTSVRMN